MHQGTQIVPFGRNLGARGAKRRVSSKIQAPKVPRKAKRFVLGQNLIAENAKRSKESRLKDKLDAEITERLEVSRF